MPCGRQQQQQQHSPIIATKTVSAEVYVFDSSSYAAENIKLPLEEHVECKPDLRLTGASVCGCVGCGSSCIELYCIVLCCVSGRVCLGACRIASVFVPIDSAAAE